MWCGWIGTAVGVVLSLRLRSMDGGARTGARLLIGCLAPFAIFAGLLLLVFVGDWPPIEALAEALGRIDDGVGHWSLVAVNVVSAWAPAVLAARAILQLRRARKRAGTA